MPRISCIGKLKLIACLRKMRSKIEKLVTWPLFLCLPFEMHAFDCGAGEMTHQVDTCHKGWWLAKSSEPMRWKDRTSSRGFPLTSDLWPLLSPATTQIRMLPAEHQTCHWRHFLNHHKHGISQRRLPLFLDAPNGMPWICRCRYSIKC